MFTIIIADDNTMRVSEVSDLLKEQDYKVLEANSDKEFRKWVDEYRKQKNVIALIDINQEDFIDIPKEYRVDNGIRMGKYINGDIPIIFITAYDDNDSIYHQAQQLSPFFISGIDALQENIILDKILEVANQINTDLNTKFLIKIKENAQKFIIIDLNDVLYIQNKGTDSYWGIQNNDQLEQICFGTNLANIERQIQFQRFPFLDKVSAGLYLNVEKCLKYDREEQKLYFKGVNGCLTFFTEGIWNTVLSRLGIKMLLTRPPKND